MKTYMFEISLETLEKQGLVIKKKIVGYMEGTEAAANDYINNLNKTAGFNEKYTWMRKFEDDEYDR